MTLTNPFPGTDEVLPRCTRRSLLGATPALLAPGLLAVPAFASTETPILALYRQHEAIDAAFAGTSDAEGDRLYELLTATEDRISAAVPTCLADLAVKVLILTQLRETSYGTVWEPALHAEMEAIVARALA